MVIEEEKTRKGQVPCYGKKNSGKQDNEDQDQYNARSLKRRSGISL